MEDGIEKLICLCRHMQAGASMLAKAAGEVAECKCVF
jgi:hypothetical protein